MCAPERVDRKNARIDDSIRDLATKPSTARVARLHRVLSASPLTSSIHRGASSRAPSSTSVGCTEPSQISYASKANRYKIASAARREDDGRDGVASEPARGSRDDVGGSEEGGRSTEEGALPIARRGRGRGWVGWGWSARNCAPAFGAFRLMLECTDSDNSTGNRSDPALKVSR
eukprot:29261-Pelagococcus_subviridis.AAC.5